MKMVRDIGSRAGVFLEKGIFQEKSMPNSLFLKNNDTPQVVTSFTSLINYNALSMPSASTGLVNDLMPKDVEQRKVSNTSSIAPSEKENYAHLLNKDKEKTDYHSPVRLLIADDNPLIRVSLANLLNKWGILFSLCEDGLQAWNQLQKETFDMLIIDMQMPNMDGYEVIQQLRSSKRNKNNAIPIVVIAGTDDAEMLNQIKAAGVDTHILKPFKPGALFNVLAKLKNIPTYKKVSFFSDALDQATLEELYGNDKDHKMMIFNLFLKSTPEILLEIKVALKEENRNQLEKLLHKLKPSFTMVGLREMTAHVQQLEKDLKEINTVELLQTTFQNFYQEVDNAIDLIRLELYNWTLD